MGTIKTLIQQRYQFLIITLLLLNGCAQHYTTEVYSDPYGLLSGIWHGLIFPLSLIANIISWFLSLLGIDFLSDIHIIGRPNTGFFYYFGFLLGLVAHSGSTRG